MALVRGVDVRGVAPRVSGGASVEHAWAVVTDRQEDSARVQTPVKNWMDVYVPSGCVSSPARPIRVPPS